MEFLAESVGLLDYSSNEKPLVKKENRCLPLGDENEERRSFDDNDNESVLAKHVVEKVCPNGAIFTGSVDAITGELLHGYCLYVEQQEAYEGPFDKNGLRHGKRAVCTKLDGSGKFLGSYQDDKFHHGTYVTSDYTYTGYFDEDSLFDGKGTLVHVDGTVYEGEFCHGIYHGIGKLIDPNNRTYEGRFENGKKHGVGKLTYQLEEGRTYCYRGEWNNEAKHGYGTETYEKENSTYDGEFQDNLRHGLGTWKSATVEMTGSWCQGRPVDGPGWKVVYPKKNISYVGEVLGGRPHGEKGAMVVRSDNGAVVVYEGSFRCGLRHGVGKITSDQDGDYDGEWRGDEPLANLMNASEASKSASVQKAESARSLVSMMEPEAEYSAMSPHSNKSVPELLELLESSCSDLSDDRRRTFSQSSHSSFHSVESTYLNYKGAKSVGDDEWLYDNGDTFSGHIDTFQNRHGFGIFTHKSTGTVYSGEWNKSRRHGKGNVTNALTGIHYSGDFVSNIIHGKGRITLMDGSTYRGDFQEGIMHGHGKFVDTISGSVYTGEFDQGVKHGYGEETYKDGTAYKGEFRNWKRCGKGSLYSVVDGVEELVYKGEWKDDIISGDGERFDCTEPCRGSYVGEFHMATRHGHGTFKTESGRVYEGPWTSDTLDNGDWVISCPRGSVFYGAATCDPQKNDGLPLPNGFGTHKDVNGDFYTGSFVDGERDGSGLCVFDGGEQWDGKWEAGVFVKYNRRRP